MFHGISGWVCDEETRALLGNRPGDESLGSVSERAIATSTARSATVARSLTSAFALSLAKAFPLPLALAATGSLALALAPAGAGAVADAVVRADAAIRLLALFLARGAFGIGLRRSAVSASAAGRAALGECGACGQKRECDEGADACGFHDDLRFGVSPVGVFQWDGTAGG